MDDPQLLANVFTAISGLVGALIGAGAAIAALDRDRSARAKAATRAVHMECSSNATLLGSLADGDDAGPISNGVWLSNLAELALYLKDDQLRTVGIAYLLVPVYEDARQGLRSGHSLSVDTVKLLRSGAEDFTTAANTLRPLVWPRSKSPLRRLVGR